MMRSKTLLLKKPKPQVQDPTHPQPERPRCQFSIVARVVLQLLLYCIALFFWKVCENSEFGSRLIILTGSILQIPN